LVLIALATLLISLLEKRWREEGENRCRWEVVQGYHKGKWYGRTWHGGQGQVGRFGVWEKGHAIRLSRSGEGPHRVHVSSWRETINFYDKGVDDMLCRGGGRKMGRE
jgi:hypothetical protein